MTSTKLLSDSNIFNTAEDEDTQALNAAVASVTALINSKVVDSIGASATSAPSQHAVQTALALKANQSDLTALTATVASIGSGGGSGGGSTSIVDTLASPDVITAPSTHIVSAALALKADATALSTLSTTVSSKANTTDLTTEVTRATAAEAALGTLKANAADLTTEVNRATAAEAVLATGKANVVDLTALTTTVAAKANTSDLTALSATVAAKVNTTDLSALTGSGLVGYTGAGAGLVLRDVGSRLRDRYSVKDYGVIGDGVADDTTAINNAIAAVAALAQGGELYFPRGTYLISNTINAAVGVSLRGSGRTTTTIKCVTNGITMFSFLNINTYGIVVSGMSISGINSATGTIGVFVSGSTAIVSHMVFRDVQFINHNKGLANGGGFGLLDSQFDSCDFLQCFTWGLEVAGQGISAVDCKFRSSGNGTIHSYFNVNSMAGVGYVNCRWNANTTDVVMNGIVQRSATFMHCRFDLCKTMILSSTGGTNLLHGTTFYNCVFTPSATCTGNGVISVPAASLAGLLTFDTCTVINSTYASAAIPSAAQMAASAITAANFGYSRNNCMLSNATANTPTLYANDLSNSTGAANVGVSFGVTVDQVLVARQMRSVLEFMTAAQISDVTSGTPVLDVWSAFDACRAWCQANKYSMYIPPISAKLSKNITSAANLSVFSDSRATLTWTSTTDCGWTVDGIGLGGEAGYARIELPRLVGPNNTSGYATRSFDMSAYVGKGLVLKDSIWCNITAQYFIGWGTAFEMQATTTPTDNHSIDLGTIDLCTTGISINSASSTTAAIGQSKITTRNVYAYTPYSFIGNGGGTFQIQIDSTSAVVNQSGGVIFFFGGTVHSNHSIRVGTIQNRYLPDSPTTTPTTYRGRIVGGDQTVLSETGWAAPLRTYIEVSFDDLVYAAGDAISCKLSGSGSRLVIKAPVYNSQAAIALSGTQGEVNYNGGLGGASIHRWTSASVSLSGLAAGATRNFYFYHQRLNPIEFNPITCGRAPGATATTDINVEVLNNNFSVKREAIIQVINRTAAALTGVYNLMIGVE